MPKSKSGLEAFHANIAAMKKVGQENRERRQAAAQANTTSHLATMAARGTAADDAKERRRLEGIARRDAHNAKLREQREERLAGNERMKTVTLRAAA